MNGETATRWVEAMTQRRSIIRFDAFDPCPGGPWSLAYNTSGFLTALQNMDRDDLHGADAAYSTTCTSARCRIERERYLWAN